MATVKREISIAVPVAVAWEAVADVGNVHRRLVPGLVSDTVLRDGVRTVTFADGSVLREAIVSVDPDGLRVAYGSIGGRASHHNSSIEVVATGGASCRLVWTTDVLPDSVAPYILGNVEAALPIMKATIEEGYTAVT